MYFAYVIKSRNNDYLYKGFCSDLERRLKQHNSGMTKSIKKFIPFDVVYYEICDTKEEAVKKERFWKTAAGRKYLKIKMIS